MKATRETRRYIIAGAELSREEIVHKYLHLVKYVAGRISINLPPNVEINDLINDGILGLIDAIEKYDDARGVNGAKLRRRPGLPLEPRETLIKLGDVRPLDFDGQPLAEAQVGGLEDDRHAALAQPADDGVLAVDDVAWVRKGGGNVGSRARGARFPRQAEGRLRADSRALHGGPTGLRNARRAA